MNVLRLQVDERRGRVPVLFDRDLRNGIDRGRHRRGERGGGRLRVGGDAMGGRVDLVDLRRGNVDVDQRLSGEEIRAEIESRVLSERIADRQDDVRGDQGLPGRRVAAIAEDPERQRVIFGNDSLAVERGGERDLEAFDQRLQLRPRAAADRAKAEESDHRFALAERIGERGGGARDFRRIGQDRFHVEPYVAVIVDRLPVLGGQVLRYMDVDRTGSAFEREIDGFLQHVAGLGNALEEKERLVVAANMA